VLRLSGFFICCALLLPALGAADADPSSDTKVLNILFIGNSYTSRHNLAQVVESMAEAGHPGLIARVKAVVSGSLSLRDHWQLGSQNFVKLHTLTEGEEQATISLLEKAQAENPENRNVQGALKRHRDLIGNLEESRVTWDVVVLQSYRDDSEREASPYHEYAQRFAELAEAQGARVILYETTQDTLNAEPLTQLPDPAPALEKARSMAALAERLDARVAPMSLIRQRCQTERPDLTLRFVNDVHLNHTMAYLSACAIYAALFDQNPEGLPVNSVTDTRFWMDTDRARDRDGNPITHTFSDEDRATLQRMAWESYQEFEALRKEFKALREE